MKFTVYKITDNETGKCYIGATKLRLSGKVSRHRTNARNGYPSPLCRRIREVLGTKFTAEEFNFKFSWEAVDCTDSKEEMERMEEFYIAYYDSFRNGYNATKDGKDTRNGLTEDTRSRLRTPKKTRKNLQVHGKAVSSSGSQGVSGSS